MTRAVTLLLVFGACAGPDVEPPPPPAAIPIIQQADIQTMADGRCFSLDPGRPQFQTITQQVLVEPEVRAADGTITRPAIFRNVDQQIQVIRDNPPRFEVVCPQDLSQSFVASLQRALAARGAYGGAINGLIDDGTKAAIREFQAKDGPYSSNLAVRTAQTLGLLSVVGSS